MSRTYSDEEKQQYIEEFKNSGMSQNQFAEETGIPKTTLGGWLKTDEKVGFGEINLKPKNLDVSRVAKKITVFANETVRIELKEGYNKELVLKMVEVLVNC